MKCNVCNSEDKLYQKMTVANLNIGTCGICGVTQLFDVPIKDDWSVVNRSVGMSTDYRDGKKKQLKDFIEKYNIKSVCEVGCGDGQFLDIFKELGITGKGYETGRENIFKCTEKGYKVSERIDDKHSFMCAFHVLEHAPYPMHFMLDIYLSLKQNGLLLLEVPNFDFILESNLWMEITEEHRFYYEKRSLAFLLSMSGFDILSIEENGFVLTAVAQKKVRELTFDVAKTVNAFEESVKDKQYAIYGASHYTRLLLGLLKHKPDFIFDSNPKKIGEFFCGYTVLDKSLISNTVNTIAICCGMYNDEIYKDLQKYNKELIIWS